MRRQDWRPFGVGRIVRKLDEIAPDVGIVTKWEEDPSYRWDGEGPDPREEGYVPHDVWVIAEAWDRGRKFQGQDVLGGVYEKPGSRDPMIHGYFYQMLDQALGKLAAKDLPRRLRLQVAAARRYVWDEMERIYGISRRRRERGR